VTACRDRINADRRLLDHDSQLADEVGYLSEFGLIAMIDGIGQALNALVVTDGRKDGIIG
jgi:hypothetical protein